MTHKEFAEELRSSNCKKCKLCEGRTKIVVGRGNSKAPVLFIGEAPGADEDKTGQAFVGKSGKLLDSLLRDIGVDPVTDCRFSNICRCRPPENRKPKPKEIEACLPYLMEEVSIIRPKIVVTLGATPASVLAKRSIPMQGFAGKFFKMSQFPHLDWPFCRGIFFSYHPAAACYDPNLESTMFDHFLKLKRIVQKEVFGG